MESWRNRTNAPTAGTALGLLADIGPSGKEYVLGRGLSAFRMFAIRHAGGARAYVNLCPHYSLPLNHRSDQFLTRDGDRIMCRQHLALFAIEDGTCLDGACEGEGLQAVPVHVADGVVIVG